ncbi:MAG: hypothetical protein H7A24_11065 [Leptospiraceae bacterium]|nr:hypothetical protein [Leptospiraceae bacterium]MCP5512413.1 hypothetical protein [Leptospiraceae bacterium]
MRYFSKQSLLPLKGFLKKLQPSWEQDIVDIILTQSNFGLLILAFMAIIGQVYFIYFDIQHDNHYSAGARFATLIICFLYVVFYKQATLSKFDWSRILVLLFILGEIETEIYSVSTSFHDPFVWIMIPLVMLYHAFYFRGRPGRYMMFWFFIVLYYYFRLALSPVASFLDQNLIFVLTYIFPFYIFSSGFNFFWFRTRYTNQLYLRNLERETIKRIEVEKELAAELTRKSILDDIHDHLGSAILDLKWNLSELLDELDLDEKKKQLTLNIIYRVEDALRMNINSFSDSSIIQKDFFSGIKSVLFRRYGIFHRKIKILMNGRSLNNYSEATNVKFIQQLYLICMEICSNDLKYGYGAGEWAWTFSDNLTIEIQSFSNYDKNQEGRGTSSIASRITNMGGSIQNHFSNDIYSCKIVLPLTLIT